MKRSNQADFQIGRSAMEQFAPPPVIDSARVLAYAVVPVEMPFSDSPQMYVDGVVLGRVPHLAICENLAVSRDSVADLFLVFCDLEWGSIAAAGGDSIKSLQARAEQNYPGISKHWVMVDTTIEEALRFYDEEMGNLRCSFCKKRAFEMDNLACAESAAICNECVDMLHQAFHDGK